MSEAVAFEMPNGAKWIRRFGPEDGEWERNGIEMDFTSYVVELFLNDTGMFTSGEACLVRWTSTRSFAEVVADILEKRQIVEKRMGLRERMARLVGLGIQ